MNVSFFVGKVDLGFLWSFFYWLLFYRHDADRFGLDANYGLGFLVFIIFYDRQ